jgi:hypothetical protein
MSSEQDEGFSIKIYFLEYFNRVYFGNKKYRDLDVLTMMMYDRLYLSKWFNPEIQLPTKEISATQKGDSSDKESRSQTIAPVQLNGTCYKTNGTLSYFFFNCFLLIDIQIK